MRKSAERLAGSGSNPGQKADAHGNIHVGLLRLALKTVVCIADRPVWEGQNAAAGASVPTVRGCDLFVTAPGTGEEL